MSLREVSQVIHAMPASDGAGVKLLRSLGARPDLRLDPFLMLDEFSSDDAQDYIAGFPPHPHRGFQTVTYMLQGQMLHEDHMGNRGELGPGDVQWMNAGRGVIHSEMPQQEEGRMQGFQLWLNLPASEKMQAATYQDIAHAQIPSVALPQGGTLKLIAGELTVAGQFLQGPVTGLSTEPLYADASLPAGADLQLALASERNAFIYVYEGELEIAGRLVAAHHVAILGAGDDVQVLAHTGVRFLLLAGKPIGEPVAQYGPFVMNSKEEIQQALQDYSDGTLTA